MAKGNILVNGFTGKLGNMVFAKVNGQEVARGYNPSPKVSYTTPQCLQRGKMKSLVLFWQRLTGGQSFKFAFGDKKAKQSDFNRFVQVNMLSAPVSFPNSYWVSNASFTWKDDSQQSHTLSNNQIPASGMVSQGSVCTIQGQAQSATSGTNAAYAIPVAGLGPWGSIVMDTATVELLKGSILVNNTLGMQAGDKVTFLGLYPNDSARPIMIQLTLGVEQDFDTEKLSDVGIYAGAEGFGLITSIASSAKTDGIFSLAIILSRKDNVGGVSKQNMSTSYFCLSPAAGKLVTAMGAEEYQTAVAKAWGESVSLLQSV